MYQTYSFKACAGSFSHPNASIGTFQFYGQIGMGEFIVRMVTERGQLLMAADGTPLVYYIAGANGEIEIQVQQTSSLHDFLLNWANIVMGEADQQQLSDFAAATLTVTNNVDGSSHVCTGVFPTKIPDKTYAPAPQMLTWRLMCADIKNTTASPN